MQLAMLLSLSNVEFYTSVRKVLLLRLNTFDLSTAILLDGSECTQI